jgi:hypothetical protein
MSDESRKVWPALVAVAAITLCSEGLVTAAGEKERLGEVLSQLSHRLDTLEHDQLLAPSVEQAKGKVQWFEGKLASWSPASAEEGRPLREGLEYDLQALQGLSTERGLGVEVHPPAAAEVVAEVVADLTVKVAHCRQLGLAALVTAKVRTVRAGQEVSGLEVFYVQKILESKIPANPPRFPTLSATEHKLAPGRYVFWAGRSAETASRSTIAVGNGEPETRIDLLVP